MLGPPWVVGPWVYGNWLRAPVLKLLAPSDGPFEDVGKTITNDFADGKDLLVTILSSMNEEAAVAVKELPPQ